jgi:LemA protein
MDEKGKQRVLSDQEFEELLNCANESRQYDDLLLAESGAIKARKRKLYTWCSALLAVWLLVIGLAMLCSSGDLDAELQTSYQGMTSGELDDKIAGLDSQLRKPGNASKYTELSIAYAERYRRAEQESDLVAAIEAEAKAKRLNVKKGVEGTTMRSPILFGVLFIFLAIGGTGVLAMVFYNGLVKSDEIVDERWSQVETVMQRRLDLIPNLVKTVKGYAAHEKETLTNVMEARAEMFQLMKATAGGAPKTDAAIAGIAAAQASLSSSLGRLLAIAESYPDLKASSNFMALQDQLEGTENRIAVERGRYNDAVKGYNVKTRRFPSNIVAAMFGFAPRAYFESLSNAHEAVEVKF